MVTRPVERTEMTSRLKSQPRTTVRSRRAPANSGVGTRSEDAKTTESANDNTDNPGDANVTVTPKQKVRHKAHTSSEDAHPGEAEPTHVVCQHLLITEPMPVPTGELQKHEHNLAGKSLLQHLAPNDWPSVQQIARAQADIPEAVRRTLRKVDTAVPDVSLRQPPY